MDLDADYSQLEEGVWTDTFKGSTFLVSHISCLKFQKALARLQQPYRRKLADGTMDPAKNKEILCQAMAEGLVHDWTGVTSKGQNVPYDPKIGLKALMKDPELRDFITDFASTLGNYMKDEVEELGKP